VRRQIDQDCVAELSHHLLHRIAGIFELASAAELFVLNQQRQFA